MSKPEDFKFDSRVRERLLRGRSLSAAELRQHLDALPDLEGEYELMNDTPQPAVTPARDHADEPLVFDGIRRLQALPEPHSGLRSNSSSGSAASSALPPREPPVRNLGGGIVDSARGPGPALRSALMESEISGVGAGAVSAALGAMTAEARSAAGFPPVVPVSPPLTEEPHTPVTLRSQAAPEGLSDDDHESEAEQSGSAVADWEAPYPDSEDMK